MPSLQPGCMGRIWLGNYKVIAIPVWSPELGRVTANLSLAFPNSSPSQGYSKRSFYITSELISLFDAV